MSDKPSYGEQTYVAVSELLEKAALQDGQILVAGCSTSEIVGRRIGTASSFEIASQVYQGIQRAIMDSGVHIFLAVQACEHINRALIMELACQQAYDLEEVSVVPVLSAGGGMATHTYQQLSRPVVVEFVKAHAGVDIGGTLIGMHLRHVATPIAMTQRYIGEAYVTAARTRPKLIGGGRAVYSNLRRCSF